MAAVAPTSNVKTQPMRKLGGLGRWLNRLLEDVRAIDATLTALKQSIAAKGDFGSITLKVCIDGEEKYIDVALYAGPRETP